MPGDLTAEHVLPKWLWRGPNGDRKAPRQRAGIEPAGLQEMHLQSEEGILGAYYVERGHPFVPAPSRTVKIVCASCNNGWMSSLEGACQELLRKLVGRPRWRLKPQEISLLRRWAMKTAVLHEFTDADCRLVDREMLQAIQEGREPPGTWYVGLARAHESLGEGLESCPVVLNFSSAAGEDGRDDPARQMVYANHHLITVWGLAIIVRYSPCPIEAPARLDHDLRVIQGGPPLTITAALAGRVIQRRDLALWTLGHAHDSDAWSHSLDERGGMQLACRADGIFIIIHGPLANDSDFDGFATALEVLDAVGGVQRVSDVQDRVTDALADPTHEPSGRTPTRFRTGMPLT